MTKQQIITLISKHLPELKQQFGVTQLALFGSAARNETTPQSDIDLLVDFGKAPTFRQYTGALLYLEDLLGCKVDLVTIGSLKPELESGVQQDLHLITYGA